MAILKENPKLIDYQTYMQEVAQERGWDKNTAPELYLLFVEEVGELAKAIRNEIGLFQEAAKLKKDKRRNLEEEFADVLGYIFDLANHFEVDLEKAFREKEELNNQRTWK